MCKAYDKIEWNYLERVMLELGFNTKWVNLVMMCVSSMSYSFIVNGSLKGYMLLSRGLRQGDPISPYIFLLCVEGLSGVIQGISIFQNALSIHHLLLADDCFVFVRTRREDWLWVKSILNSYEGGSCQQVNLLKSAVSFRRNIRRGDQISLVDLIRMEWVDRHEKYLELPTFMG
ncbi:hypothetical protein EV1_031745 [Malus domestica]